MNRLLTSLALLVATLVPAQAGLLDWGSDEPTTLTGGGALFTTSHTSDGIANIAPGHIICGIFDFGNINGRDVFGLMKAQISFDGTSLARPVEGTDTLSSLLGANGASFKTQYDALTPTGEVADPIFALFSTTDDVDLSIANASDPLLGITPGQFELDLLAGDGGTSDLLSLANNEFLMGLTVTQTNGSVDGFADISYGSGSDEADLVTVNPLDTISDLSGWAFQISSGPTLQFNAVPEPSSLAILGLVGVAGSAMRRRRRK